MLKFRSHFLCFEKKNLLAKWLQIWSWSSNQDVTVNVDRRAENHRWMTLTASDSARPSLQLAIDIRDIQSTCARFPRRCWKWTEQWEQLEWSVGTQNSIDNSREHMIPSGSAQFHSFVLLNTFANFSLVILRKLLFLFIQLFKSLFAQMYYMYFYVLTVGIPILREQNEVAITRPLVWLFETMYGLFLTSDPSSMPYLDTGYHFRNSGTASSLILTYSS